MALSLTSLTNLIRYAFPGKPTFTDNDVPDLKGKVTIVTGANTGLGKLVAQSLYSKNAKVYMMARSEDKTMQAIESIKASVPVSTGEMIFIPLDLADLPTVQHSANEFLRREQTLHLLFNNAGVGFPEKGSKTKQGYELQLGVNCIGPFELTKHLTPTLVSTAKNAPPNTVRVVWVSSSAAEGASPKNFVQNLSPRESVYNSYLFSKLGNYLHATEFAARHKADGIVSVSLNPGNLKTELWRSQGSIMTFLLNTFVLYPSIYGSYTILFAGFSPQVTMAKTGSFIAPWGRFMKLSSGMANAAKLKTEGGTGDAREFWDWTEAQVRQNA